ERPGAVQRAVPGAGDGGATAGDLAVPVVRERDARPGDRRPVRPDSDGCGAGLGGREPRAAAESDRAGVVADAVRRDDRGHAAGVKAKSVFDTKAQREDTKTTK